MTESIQECDVCVIGTGASGSIVCQELVERGIQVIAIEEGPSPDGGISYRDVMIKSEPAWCRQPYGGGWGKVAYPWSSRNVGGGTVFYGGASFRYRRIDFDVESATGSYQIPLRWPYAYEDLSPFYDELEQRLEISADNTLDPTFPGSASTTPNPPHEYSPEAKVLVETSSHIGLHPFPTPLAISSARLNKGSEHLFIEDFDTSGARRDCFTTFIKPALKRQNFTLLKGTIVKQLCQEKEGLVSEALCWDLAAKQSIRVRAKVFVVAANAIHTPALLLRSSNRFSPTGIGNERDLLGRYLCFKMSEYVVGVLEGKPSASPILTNHGVFSSVAWTDYYQSKELPLGLGGLIYEARYGFPFYINSDQSVVRLECILADQPAHYNQVFCVGDSIGIDYQAHPLDLTRLDLMSKRCEDILRHAGCKHIRREPSGWTLGSTHLHGTCRAGTDPQYSVVNSECRLHGIENVYVADGSFMPYPGSVNPTLTIQANALRTARGISTKHFR